MTVKPHRLSCAHPFDSKKPPPAQAGPSAHMNWYSANGNGGTVPAGARGSDADAMNGNAVLYDAVAGKILTVGGAPSYQVSLAEVIALPACNGTAVETDAAASRCAMLVCAAAGSMLWVSSRREAVTLHRYLAEAGCHAQRFGKVVYCARRTATRQRTPTS